MKPTSLLAGLLTASVLLGCTGPAARPNPTDASKPEQKDAFLWLRDIDGFNSIDDEHIVVSAGTKHALVTTFGPCFDLRYAETIAIDAPLGFLDKSGVGNIVYQRFPSPRGRCPIDRVVAVEGLKQAKELVAKEKAEKNAKPAS